VQWEHALRNAVLRLPEIDFSNGDRAP
jgi:hypothetical protein